MKNLLLSIAFALSFIASFAQGNWDYVGTATGTNTYSVNILTPTFPTAFNGTTLRLHFTNSNTTAATITVVKSGSSIGPAAIRKWDGDSWEPLVSGDIPAGGEAILHYDNSNSYFKAIIFEALGSGGSVTDGNATTGNGSAADLGGAMTENTSIDGGGIYSLSLGSSGSRLSTFTGEIAGASVWRTFSGNMSFRAGDNFGFFSDGRMMRIYNGSATPGYTSTHPNVALQIQGAFTSFGGPTEFIGLMWLPNSSTAHINAISSTPPTGGFVYDVDVDRLKYYTGSAWESVANLDDVTGGTTGELINEDVTGTTYTITDADAGKMLHFTNASGCTVTMDNTLTADRIFNFTRDVGAGIITFEDDGTSVLTAAALTLEVPSPDNIVVCSWNKRDAVNYEGFGQLGTISGGGGDVASVFGRTGAVVAVSGDYEASEITNTPAGTIAADDVQEALNELDTEKQTLDSDLTAIAGLSPSNDDILQRKSGAWTNRTVSQLKTDIGVFGSAVNGLAPLSGGGTTNFLRADGTWTTPGGSGTVTSVAMTVPSFLSIAGSPVTTTGTLAVSLSGTALPVANGGTGITSIGSGVATFWGTPSYTNFLAAVTGTSPWYNLGSGGAITSSHSFSGAFAVGYSDAAFQMGLGVAHGSITANTRLHVRGISAGNVQRWENNSGTELWRLTDGGRLAFGGGSTAYFAAANGTSETVTGGGIRIVGANRGHSVTNSGATHNSADPVLQLNGSYTVGANSSSNGGAFLVNTTFANTNATGFTGAVYKAGHINPGINATFGTTSAYGLYIDWTQTSITGTSLFGVVVEDTNANNGFGTTTPTATLHVVGTTKLEGSVTLPVAGNGILIKEGSNATSGLATLSGGTVVVSTTKVTSTSRIQLTAQSLGTIVVPAALAVSARTASTSFTILSSDITDTSTVAWVLIEPAP